MESINIAPRIVALENYLLSVSNYEIENGFSVRIVGYLPV